MTAPEQIAAIRLFDEFRAAFPRLRMDLRPDHENVEVMLDIPVQSGSDFHINLNLQGDELHLSAGALWLEWFPCTEREVVRAYRDAVFGLLAGRYRITEWHIGSRPVRAQLQRPEGENWQTIGTWSNIGAFVPWRQRARVLQNRGSVDAG